MSFTNPLHSSVGNGRKSDFSALGPALNNPTKTGPSQCRRVPQTPYASQSDHVQPVHNAITFDYIGYPNQGMPLRELRARGPHALAQMMQGANDQVLGHTQLRKINLHIRWPGYEHIEWIHTIDVVTESGPISRGQLAHAVAQNFVRYVEKTQYEATPSKDWRLGPAGIVFEHIVLHSLRHVFGDAWQAEVSVSFR
ncbi:hypothetical protein Moror_5610 [Moniliophthora roreri MCA 2997]|uniref:Uncharacterized protein n=1 Tax=Moniliophthora roreri (strain MCA 2997) TaxID=1381753 RepID=V2X6Q2_MONRO|nr:hypothetical protein Moror_5610 [Moniliophthora roreri MCA 2997]